MGDNVGIAVYSAWILIRPNAKKVGKNKGAQ